MTALEFIKAILLIITMFVVIIFLYSKFVRLFKKKSYHYIVPPEPENDKNWNPIDFSKYDSFIFIKNSSEEYIIEKLRTVLNTENNEPKIKAIDLELIKQNDWILLKIKNSSFDKSTSLVWWLNYYSDNIKVPEEVIGFCQHKTISLQDYIFKIDKAIQEENFIGSFRNGKNFGIYLPNAALHKSGNISLSRNHEINFYSEISKLPIELLEGKMIPYEKVIKYYRQQCI